MQQSENKNGTIYAVNQPYPEIGVREKNPVWAREILDNVGGAVSEIGAVSLYFYNHLMTEDYQEVALSFHKISIVEMHHLEIFGRLAHMLGADPRLWSVRGSQMSYWNGSRLPYCNNLKDILHYSISEEKAAIEKYSHQIHFIQDDLVVANLQRILADEKLHITILTQLTDKYVS